MKSTKQHGEEASKPSTKRKASRNTADLQKSTSCSTVQQSNAKRPREHLVELYKKNGDSQVQGCSRLNKVDAPVAADRVSSVSHEHQTILFPSAKIKLQLFPLDRRMGMELEKDGYNPHLELTLNARKKISSVIKHLHNKWGSSTIAMGEPILFPFKVKLERLNAYRCWTLTESGITAGDVHAAMGCPAIFRLRYGWFSTEQKSILIPSSTSSLACTQSYAAPEGCDIIASPEGCDIIASPEGCDIRKASTPTKVISEQLKAVNVSEQPTIDAVEQLPPADPFNTEGQWPKSGVPHASALWGDSLSNISFGALLSEDSLLGKCSMLDPRSNDGRCVSQSAQLPADSMDAFISNHLKSAQEPVENRSVLQSSTVVADSLDAFITYHLNNDQEDKSSKEELQPSQLIADSFDASIAKFMRNAQDSRTFSMPSSILDAEETCHSFAFKKPHSSRKEFIGDGRSFFASVTAQDLEHKSVNSSKATEAGNKEDESTDDPKPEPEGQYSRGLLNDESSLGFSKINWSDSMGPFELGLSSQQMIKGDSISIGEFVR